MRLTILATENVKLLDILADKHLALPTATTKLADLVKTVGISVAKVRRNRQTCGVNLSGTTKCGVTTPHSQLFVMQRKSYENENFTLK